MRKIPAPDKLVGYWHGLGKFVQRYAEVEYVLNNVLRVASGLTIEHARAVFSGARVDASVSFIKRLHEADDAKLSPWLEKAFSKIGEITAIRDSLLHHGINAQTGPETFQITNRDRTLARAAINMEISVRQLDDLEADLITIFCCLCMYWIEERHPKMNKARVASYEAGALAPWRYKSTSPRKSLGVFRGSAPKR